MKHVYLDNAATTPMDPEVIQVMTDQMQNDFGNASSTHYFGRNARKVLDESRHTLAQSINAKDDEIIFTSGATESNNTAILQTAKKRQHLGRHIITTAVEHPSVLNTMKFLESKGFEVTYLPVDEQGLISLEDFDEAFDDATILVSIMMVNNETGDIMPIKEIGDRVKDTDAWFHTDATQAYGLLDIDVKADHIDLLSVSAHKINGPKFIGFLYQNEDIYFDPLLNGGEQELKRRAGTENIPAIAGFAKAVELLTPERKQQLRTDFSSFKAKIVEILTENDVEFEINGATDEQNAQHVFNLFIPGISTYVLQMNLDLAGFAISGGSACTAGDLEPSHVLIAMFGEESPKIQESIRISFGHETTIEDVTEFAETLVQIVNKRLNKSPKKVSE